MFKVIKGDDFSDLLKDDICFVLCIGNTKTAEIAGITVAGESEELIKFTPPADAELLYYGRCKTIPFPPVTPDGKPTPAVITYTALRLLETPLFVVDSGVIVKPKIPYYSINAPTGENIAERSAMDIERVKEAFEYGKILGREISKAFDAVMIGESIPAGTTTAGAVLKAMGMDAKVSSSMPNNPIDLKMKVIEKAVKRVKSEDPLEILAEVGDPVLLAVASIAIGSKKPVILAGGTQMAAAANLILALDTKEVYIATTKYIADDRSADIKAIAPVSVIAADPQLERSTIKGLRAYGEGFVKEGVGAGGATLLAYVKGIKPDEFLKEIELSYKVITSR